MTAPDDASIPDTDTALRWIIDTKDTVVYDHNDQRWVPTAAAFIRHEDGISVYRRMLLDERGDGAADVLATKPSASLVAAVEASVIRKDPIGCGLINDVPDPPAHPIDYAHALITVDATRSGKARKRQVDAVARGAQIVLGDVLRPPPPL